MHCTKGTFRPQRRARPGELLELALALGGGAERQPHRPSRCARALRGRSPAAGRCRSAAAAAAAAGSRQPCRRLCLPRCVEQSGYTP
jgi:hypothetical protein